MVFVNACFGTIDLLIYNQLIVCNCNNMFKANLKELLGNFLNDLSTTFNQVTTDRWLIKCYSTLAFYLGHCFLKNLA